MLLSQTHLCSRPALSSIRCRRGGRTASRHAHAVHASTRVSFSDPSTGDSELSVNVFVGAPQVAAELCRIVESAALESIAARGCFSLAIPGGSVLKMCAGLADSASFTPEIWSKTHIFYVNHKAVALDDELATCRKAKALFLDRAPGFNVYLPQGTKDAAAEASAYEAALRNAVTGGFVEADKTGKIPTFDLMLLGMGSDGHVGSLYPNRPEISSTDGRWVLPVVKGEGPASFTLSLAVMNAAKRTVIALTGEKKAPAVVQALEERLPAGQFPAQSVRSASRTWLLDAGAAGALKAVRGLQALH